MVEGHDLKNYPKPAIAAASHPELFATHFGSDDARNSHRAACRQLCAGATAEFIVAPGYVVQTDRGPLKAGEAIRDDELTNYFVNEHRNSNPRDACNYTPLPPHRAWSRARELGIVLRVQDFR
jgi:hypothetical protein